MNRLLIATRKSAYALPAVAKRATRRDPEIEFLARQVWQAEGCPVHRWAACRREVELQLRATRPLLVQELAGVGG